MPAVTGSMSRTASLSTVQVAVVVAVAIVAGGAGAIILADVAPADRPADGTAQEPAVSTFDSAEEFRSYIRAADRPNRPTRGDEVS